MNKSKRTFLMLMAGLASVAAYASYSTITVYNSSSADTYGAALNGDGTVIAYLADNGTHLKLKVGSASAITINGTVVPCSRPYVNRDGTAVSFYGRNNGGGSSYPYVYVVSAATLYTPSSVSGANDPSGITTNPSLTILSGNDHNPPALSNVVNVNGDIYCCWPDLRIVMGGLGGPPPFNHELVWWKVGTSAGTTFTTVANVDTFNPTLTSNGEHVATRAGTQVYYDNTPLGTTMTAELVSKSSAGTTGNSDSDNPTMSYEGSVVAFDSASTNLIASDNNAARDVFVRDRTGGSTTRPYSDTTSGSPFLPNDTVHPSLSPDGTWLGFHTSNKIVLGDAGGTDVDGVTIHNGPYAMIIGGIGSSPAIELVSNKSGSATIGYAGLYASVANSGIISFASSDNGIASSGETSGKSNVYVKSGHF